ncbi:hypothetical protein [Phenylobacterium deserti]|uniref:HPF/RaiA family ribosome-associated protein n=1 Tax=Phenylobacterium deserti TaxID=1914756 RepID=A0A328AV60_9CAUL|nr:hypothetical protein [Phenylobacterium deserti]RAK57606.1 hypothetical protein DJ018_06670 [Phenylobacterium deserti]
MPDKHPNTTRWGGPGASHEDRTKPMPTPAPAQPEGAASTNPRVSQVSTGGGERDEKHSHVDAMRSSKSHATDTPSPTSSKDWRQNRSRHDREAQVAAAEDVGEPRSFRGGAPDEAGSPDAPDAGHGTPVRVTLDADHPGGAGVAGEAEQRVRRAIARFDRDLSEVQIYLADATGQGSPGPKSCTIQAVLHRGETIAVTESSREVEQSLMLASRELVRRLAEELGYGGGKPDAAGEAAPHA